MHVTVYGKELSCPKCSSKELQAETIDNQSAKIECKSCNSSWVIYRKDYQPKNEP